MGRNVKESTFSGHRCLRRNIAFLVGNKRDSCVLHELVLDFESRCRILFLKIALFLNVCFIIVIFFILGMVLRIDFIKAFVLVTYEVELLFSFMDTARQTKIKYDS